MRNTLILALALLIAGCGAPAVTQQTTTPPNPPPPSPPSFTPIPVAGQWMIIVIPLGLSNQEYSLVELNLSQSGTQIFASTQQVAVFLDQATGTYLGHPIALETALCGPGGGGDSFEGGFTGASQASFTFYDPFATISGQFTFDQNNVDFPGTTVVSANFSVNGPCFSDKTSGGLYGVLIKPFSGTYAGMLNSQPVILTMIQGANYSFSANGTDNAAAITLSGQVIGGAFFATDGRGNSYTGIYDPHANNFLIYGNNFTFLGQLNAGSVP